MQIRSPNIAVMLEIPLQLLMQITLPYYHFFVNISLTQIPIFKLTDMCWCDKSNL